MGPFGRKPWTLKTQHWCLTPDSKNWCLILKVITEGGWNEGSFPGWIVAEPKETDTSEEEEEHKEEQGMNNTPLNPWRRDIQKKKKNQKKEKDAEEEEEEEEEEKEEKSSVINVYQRDINSSQSVINVHLLRRRGTRRRLA